MDAAYYSLALFPRVPFAFLSTEIVLCISLVCACGLDLDVQDSSCIGNIP